MPTFGGASSEDEGDTLGLRWGRQTPGGKVVSRGEIRRMGKR